MLKTGNLILSNGKTSVTLEGWAIMVKGTKSETIAAINADVRQMKTYFNYMSQHKGITPARAKKYKVTDYEVLD